jgi:DNA adenine methylase
MSSPTRPMLRYFGGKWRLAPWIVQQFPAHRVYVEPFGGAASVLLLKPRASAEIYNDLDGEIVNLFRVVRDAGPELLRVIELTPYARDEFDASFETSSDPIEQARRTLIRSYMGFGGNLTRPNQDQSTQRTGFRVCSKLGDGRTKNPGQDWRNWPEGLPSLIDRLRGVIVEQREACAVMADYDSPETLHYVDPPYVHSTRGQTNGGGSARRGYRFEMDDAQHRELAVMLAGLAGAVVVSGYDCELYRELYAGWARLDCITHADGARARTEVLWLRNIEADLFNQSWSL